MRLFGIGIFCSAFLLFSVQPVIARFILPWFGATPGVWTVCLLFFQVLLLLGYAYAHLLASRLRVRAQVTVHLTLLALALLTLPITPAESLKPEADTAPTLRILLVLSASVGAPFFLLAATGPLLQRWFVVGHPDRSPWRLYALSNAGSLLGLLIYPFVIERYLRLEMQTIGWSVGWLVLAALVVFPAVRVWRAPGPAAPPSASLSGDAPRPKGRVMALWVALSACGSGLLMATTNRLCLDVAVFPLLFVVPLALYLVTFIVCFDHDRWYRRTLFFLLLPPAMLAAVVSLRQGLSLSAFAQAGLGAFTLFICCMCCHGELRMLRPAPRHLTLFYLAVAFGGAIGGLFVAVISPLVFDGIYEYHLLLGLSYLLVCSVGAREHLRAPRPVRPSLPARIARKVAWAGFVLTVAVLTVLYLDIDRWPSSLATESTTGLLEDLLSGSRILVVITPLLVFLGMGGARVWRPEVRDGWRTGRRIGPFLVIVAMAWGVVPLFGSLVFDLLVDRRGDTVLAQARNFFGVLRVEEYSRDRPDHDWTLVHGRIDHGFQLQEGSRRTWPTSYYGAESGIGLAIRLHPERGREGRQFRIGVVGLGTGTLAAYANATVLTDDDGPPHVSPARRVPGDHVAFYEINPLVTRWALDRFTYLKDAVLRGAEVEIFGGDARLVLARQLERGEPGRFDVLAVDAFSSDAIPVHLLTRECFAIYEQHLAVDGILAIHITNRFLRLTPVVRRIAVEMDLPATYVENDEDEELFTDLSDWVLLTRCREFLSDPEVERARAPWRPPGPLWTDDFSSIVPLLKR